MIDPSFLKKRKPKWRYPIGSILLHIAVVGGLIILEIHLRRNQIRNEMKKALSIRPISNEELDQLVNRSRSIVETLPVDPKNAVPVKNQKAFGGEKTQRVKKETRAVGEIKPLLNAPLKDPVNAPVKTPQSPEVKMGDKLKGAEKSRVKKGPVDNFFAFDPSVAISAKTILNTDEYVYANFSNRLRELIGIPWAERTRLVFQKNRASFSIGIYKTTVRYYFTPEGTITKVILLRNSGIAELDKAAIDSVYGAKNISNPPPELFKEPFDGSLEFSFYLYIVPGGTVRSEYFSDERLERLRQR